MASTGKEEDHDAIPEPKNVAIYELREYMKYKGFIDGTARRLAKVRICSQFVTMGIYAVIDRSLHCTALSHLHMQIFDTYFLSFKVEL